MSETLSENPGFGFPPGCESTKIAHSHSHAKMAEIVLFCPFLTIFKIVFIHPLIYLTISKYSFIHYFQLQIVLFGGNDYFLCALCSIHWLCILMYFSLVPQTNCQCSSPQPPQPHPEPACTKRSISTPPSVGSYRLLFFFCRPSARASFCSQSCAVGVLVWL